MALDPSIASLLQLGSSLGGARPKATFLNADGGLWLAKSPSREDRLDVGAAEFLLHELARACVIDVPPARLETLGGRGWTFCVKRFDRQGVSRRMYWSAMTLLGKSDGDDGSYLEIAEALQNHADRESVERDLHQLSRRVLIGQIWTSLYTMRMKRTNLVLDEQLLEDALRVSGERTYSAAVARALTDFVKRARAGRILELAGSGLWDGDLGKMRNDPQGPKKKGKRGSRAAG